MSKITYEQAFEDHSYLWALNAAGDMTGGYGDQEDLEKLLRSPTKATARDCLCNQIDHWFTASFDQELSAPTAQMRIDSDPQVREIAIRHGHVEDDTDDDEMNASPAPKGET